MKVSCVKKKLKEKAFAPGVNREEIALAGPNLDLGLDEFIGLGIEGLQEVAPRSGSRSRRTVERPKFYW